MTELLLPISLAIGAGLFGIGLYGVLSQTNLVMIMMGIELILGGALVNLVAFWRFLHPDVYAGQIFVLVVMTLMALDMAVGFGVAIARFRARGSVETEEAAELKGWPLRRSQSWRPSWRWCSFSVCGEAPLAWPSQVR
jgi:NAD(P)H-quinone oxidoreductase subunit 4L